MCVNQCVIIDVTNCREKTVTRIHDALLRYTQFDTSTIEKIKHNGKCLLIKTTPPGSKSINLYRRHGSYHFQLHDDHNVNDFIENYFANYENF